MFGAWKQSLVYCLDCHADAIQILDRQALLTMRIRAFHMVPCSLAAIYAAWSLFILNYGGDWAPIYVYYPLWPFSIALESLIKMLPEAEGPSAFLNCLEIGIWTIGGMIWFLLLGYLISWSAVRVFRLFRGTTKL